MHSNCLIFSLLCILGDILCLNLETLEGVKAEAVEKVAAKDLRLLQDLTVTGLPQHLNLLEVGVETLHLQRASRINRRDSENHPHFFTNRLTKYSSGRLMPPLSLIVMPQS